MKDLEADMIYSSMAIPRRRGADSLARRNNEGGWAFERPMSARKLTACLLRTDGMGNS